MCNSSASKPFTSQASATETRRTFTIFIDPSLRSLRFSKDIKVQDLRAMHQKKVDEMHVLCKYLPRRIQEQRQLHSSHHLGTWV
mmetsp:Transcript_39655/g.82412  ORF Transcript_39655/g.82412 Transcript_39655/m.82412 type:complete len:84 (-) Transcript_39655:87-338(-)